MKFLKAHGAGQREKEMLAYAEKAIIHQTGIAFDF